MFGGATSFNGDLSQWNVGSVTNMSSMFNGATSFNQDLNPWADHLSGRTVDMRDMFDGTPLETNNNLPKWYP